MPSDEQQERLWYKTALAHVIIQMSLEKMDGYLYDGRKVRGLVHDAVRRVIEERQPVTLMDWWNLRDEFKARALEAVQDADGGKPLAS